MLIRVTFKAHLPILP